MLNGESEELGDNNGFGDQMAEFVRIIRGEGLSRIDVESVLPTMEVLDALKASVETGDAVEVRLQSEP